MKDFKVSKRQIDDGGYIAKMASEYSPKIARGHRLMVFKTLSKHYRGRIWGLMVPVVKHAGPPGPYWVHETRRDA
jgi:hypothetical protein